MLGLMQRTVPISGIADPWLTLPIGKTTDQWLARRQTVHITVALRVPLSAIGGCQNSGQTSRISAMGSD